MSSRPYNSDDDEVSNQPFYPPSWAGPAQIETDNSMESYDSPYMPGFGSVHLKENNNLVNPGVIEIKADDIGDSDPMEIMVNIPADVGISSNSNSYGTNIQRHFDEEDKNLQYSQESIESSIEPLSQDYYADVSEDEAEDSEPDHSGYNFYLNLPPPLSAYSSADENYSDATSSDPSVNQSAVLLPSKTFSSSNITVFGSSKPDMPDIAWTVSEPKQFKGQSEENSASPENLANSSHISNNIAETASRDSDLSQARSTDTGNNRATRGVSSAAANDFEASLSSDPSENKSPAPSTLNKNALKTEKSTVMYYSTDHLSSRSKNMKPKKRKIAPYGGRPAKKPKNPNMMQRCLLNYYYSKTIVSILKDKSVDTDTKDWMIYTLKREILQNWSTDTDTTTDRE